MTKELKHLITVLHVMSSADFAGGERYLYDLIRHSSDKVRHMIILPHRGLFEQILKDSNYPYVIIDMQRKFMLTAPVSLYRFIKRNQVDVIHTHGYRANFYGRLASLFTGLKNVATIHVSLFDYLETPSWKRFVYILVEKALSFKTQKYICISRAMQNDMDRLGVPNKKLKFIPNGVDISRFYPHFASSEKKAELGVDLKAPLLGTVGRMVAEKGQLHLVEALAFLHEEFRGLRCLFIGEGPMLSTLKKNAADLGIEENCIFMGFRRDVEKIYASLDLFILPSLREPFGLVLLEAMASGVPVIATASGGPLDFIRPNINGVLVPPRASKKLAVAIRRLLLNKDQAQAIAAEGLRTARDEFNIAKQAGRIENLYFSL